MPCRSGRFSARLESAGWVDDLSDLPILVPINPFTTHSCTGGMLDVTTDLSAMSLTPQQLTRCE
jgi:hypothetical protein